MQQSAFVDHHYGLIRRMYRARFAGTVWAAGLDVEDTLQTCCMGFLTRKPYDGRVEPASFIYLVLRSVVANELDKGRRKQWQVLGDERDAALRASVIAA